MDDYRDIGANDFERYEKIRARFSDIVEDFDLVTNSTPGTLRVDPVLVVYDLASAEAAPPDLVIENTRFRRQVIETSGSVAADTTQIVFFPIVEGQVPLQAGNDRTERLTALWIQIGGGSGSRVGVIVEINDGSSTSPNGVPILAVQTQSGGSTESYYSVANESSQIAGAEKPFPGTGQFNIQHITISANQGITFTIDNTGTFNACNYDLRAQYEYRLE